MYSLGVVHLAFMERVGTDCFIPFSLDSFFPLINFFPSHFFIKLPSGAISGSFSSCMRGEEGITEYSKERERGREKKRKEEE